VDLAKLKATMDSAEAKRAVSLPPPSLNASGRLKLAHQRRHAGCGPTVRADGAGPDGATDDHNGKPKRHALLAPFTATRGRRAIVVNPLQRAAAGGRLVIMDFTPEDMEAVQACLGGIDRNVPVSVEPAAAALLLPQTVYKVADLLALTEWPASQLRLVIERWQPDIEVRIERIR
jgi:hypothetical protein